MKKLPKIVQILELIVFECDEKSASTQTHTRAHAYESDA